jgi:hypothetical protein
VLDATPRQEQLRDWYSKNLFPLHAYCAEHWWREDSTDIVLRLLEQLDTCPDEVQDESAFKAWAIRQCGEVCLDRAIYRENMKLPLDQAMKMKPRRKDCKPMEYEQHGNILYIKINLPNSEDFLVWTIEAEWKNWVDAVWPVHLKNDYRLGWYLAKSTKRELRSEGHAWFPCDVNVAHLFTACLHNEYVTAKDKNMLNFTDNNLMRSDCGEKNITDPDRVPKAFQLSLDVAGLDQWRPAKPTNTNHNDTSDEDGTVSAKRPNLRKARKQAEQDEQDGIAERTGKVEILKTAQARQAAQAGLDVLWKQGTAHLSPGLEKSA